MQARLLLVCALVAAAVLLPAVVSGAGQQPQQADWMLDLEDDDPPIRVEAEVIGEETTPAAATAAAPASGGVDLPRPRTFGDFLLRHNRRYTDPDLEARRRAVFEANQREIERLNKVFEGTPAAPRFTQKPKKQSAATKFDGKGPARFGATRFGDLTREEFKKFYLNADVTPVVKKESSAVRQAKKQQTQRAATSLEQTPEKAPKKKTAKKSKKSSSSKKKKTTKRATGSAVRFAQVGLEQTPKGTTTTTTTKTTKTTTPTSKSSSGSGFVPQINTTGDKQKLYSKAEIEAWRAKAKVAPTVPYTKAKYRLVDAPVDWSALTPMIRSVGACGACWAATTADLYQASWFRAYGRPAPAMSAQHLVDCSIGGLAAMQAAQRSSDMAGYGASVSKLLDGDNAGCMGGSIMNAVRFLRKEVHEYGIYPGFMFTEAEYGSYLPLDRGVGTRDLLAQLPCSDRQSKFYTAAARPALEAPMTAVNRAKAYSGLADFSYAITPTRRIWLMVGQQNHKQVMGAPDLALGAPGTPTEKVDREALLAQALNRYGPLSVVIDASPLANYVGGVVTDAIGCSNGADDGQHHLLLVGLASNAQGQYWVLANNWGTDWGDKGYLYLKRGTNLCGITNSVIYFNMYGDATDPIAKTVEEKNVKVRGMMNLNTSPNQAKSGGVWGTGMGQ